MSFEILNSRFPLNSIRIRTYEVFKCFFTLVNFYFTYVFLSPCVGRVIMRTVCHESEDIGKYMECKHSGRTSRQDVHRAEACAKAYHTCRSVHVLVYSMDRRIRSPPIRCCGRVTRKDDFLPFFARNGLMETWQFMCILRSF
jgi:hypothetical protein